jgi:nicotinate phosphoribosyltransferase
MTGIDASDALLTDLYELTMAAGYFEHRLSYRATFELFVRSLPPQRNFLLAGGLESVLSYLENLHFTEDQIEFLRSQAAFQSISSSFFDYLKDFRFTGDVSAVPEGTPIFGEEPFVQVTAPIAEAQLVETYLLSVINYETLVATKAARVVRAAAGKPVLEFGARRAPGPEAALRAARAAYIAGCAATSYTQAGRLFGIPVAGTAAHSWTQAFDSERESFEALLDSFPHTAILLVDTYDTLAGAELAAGLGRKIVGVRLDSGDLKALSRQVRTILDLHGLSETRIIASGDLNEYKVTDILASGAPIDIFGVGTEMVTSRDLPALNVIYKLVETDQSGQVHYKTKHSSHKAYAPGRKQVFRFSTGGRFDHDIIALAKESSTAGEPLLQPVMKQGQRISAPAGIETIRARARENLDRLPDEYQELHGTCSYPVEKSKALQQLLEGLWDHSLQAAGAASNADALKEPRTE